MGNNPSSVHSIWLAMIILSNHEMVFGSMIMIIQFYQRGWGGGGASDWPAQEQIPKLAAGERSTDLAYVSFPSFQNGSNDPNLAGLFEN